MAPPKTSSRKSLDRAGSHTLQRKANVKTFDSDDEDMEDHIEDDKPIIEAVSAANNDSDGDDSDDDAPEAISTSNAETIAKESAKAAQKAIREAAAAAKKKRQDRDVKLKEQVTARKAKEAELEAEIAAAKALLAENTNEEDDAAASRRKKNALPDVLPLEFLDSDSEDDDANLGMDIQGVVTAKRRISQKPRKRTNVDRVVGGTTYRVVKKTSMDFVPATKKQTANMKNQLLKRKRTGVSTKKGFLRR
ncbi:hypothetical protein BROUX41_006218 [Berkeleyomyces rouxiae]|uniref:uncharacterized protein n=1 Tax=Berkeleyomyces rouxiae TaxID=2035830 RepID=UPI003B7ECC98